MRRSIARCACYPRSTASCASVPTSRRRSTRRWRRCRSSWRSDEATMSAFRLQRVLDLRKRREEEALARLAAASQARAATEAALEALIAEERLQRDALAQRLAGGRVDPGEVREFGRVLDVYAQAIAGKRAELQRRFEEEEQARAMLTAATIARKALDRARERHEERESAERQRQENSFLDEIASLRAARLSAASALTGGQP